MVPLSWLPTSLQELLEGTPAEEWHKIKACRATSEEAIRLFLLVPVVDLLFEKAPLRLDGLCDHGDVSDEAFEEGFQRLRGSLKAVKEVSRKLAGIARMDLREFSGAFEDWGEKEPQPRR